MSVIVVRPMVCIKTMNYFSMKSKILKWSKRLVKSKPETPGNPLGTPSMSLYEIKFFKNFLRSKITHYTVAIQH